MFILKAEDAQKLLGTAPAGPVGRAARAGDDQGGRAGGVHRSALDQYGQRSRRLPSSGRPRAARSRPRASSRRVRPAVFTASTPRPAAGKRLPRSASRPSRTMAGARAGEPRGRQAYGPLARHGPAQKWMNFYTKVLTRFSPSRPEAGSLVRGAARTRPGRRQGRRSTERVEGVGTGRRCSM